MEVGLVHKPPIFYIEVNVARGGSKIAVLRLHQGATTEGPAETSVDLHCESVF